MRKPLDIRKRAVVGVGESRKASISCCTQRKCDGCGRHVYYSKDVLHEAVANEGIEKICFVCWACAAPWIDAIARDGGLVDGAPGVLVADAIPMIEKRRREQAEMN